FFSTFGGSTVSCVVAREVLDIVDEERLQDNAKTTGDYLLEGLKELVNRHPLVGDARGMGFFIGVELVLDAKTLEPATSLASYVKNRLRDHRILIGTDGPHDNVLKIRPPLTFSHKDADLLLATLDNILQESPCVIS
ncbi:MAG: aminotransferase class III-fold pyridoxal phosphate-dependent enzyme, partial [Pseudomonadota bacterium]